MTGELPGNVSLVQMDTEVFLRIIKQSIKIKLYLENRFTPKYMYSEKTYPNYLSGTAYVMSLDVALKLYKVALRIPILHLEDVYITGVCAKQAKLRPINHPGFSYVPRKAEVCILKSAITAHKISPLNMYTTWNKVINSNVTCNTSNHNSEDKKVTLVKGKGNIGYYIVKKKLSAVCA